MEEIILDNESSGDDNNDDDVEKDEEDEEEEEHLAPADPLTVPTYDLAGITEFAATLPSSSPPPENVESLKDNNLLNHPFNINLMPIELGSFDAIIGMDWLAKYQAVIVCAEKIVASPGEMKP
ncbi:reverse transcriptase domain-containing protein [Tanacetum coccineum]